MPRLSPSASRSAWPSASAQSSTVWCSSMCRSPSQRSVAARSRRACRAARACGRRSPGRCATRGSAPRSRSTLDADPRLLRVALRPRACAAHRPARARCRPSPSRRRMRVAAGSRARPGCAANCDVGLAIADHGRARQVDAAVAQVVQHQADAGLARRRVVVRRSCRRSALRGSAMPCDSRRSAAAAAAGRRSASRGKLAVPRPSWLVTITNS